MMHVEITTELKQNESGFAPVAIVREYRLDGSVHVERDGGWGDIALPMGEAERVAEQLAHERADHYSPDWEVVTLNGELVDLRQWHADHFLFCGTCYDL